MLLFASTLPLFFIGYFILFSILPEKKAPFVAHRLSRIWAGVLFVILFLRLKIKGKEKIDPSKTYVFIANHQSQLDIPAYALSCTNTLRFLSKAELTKIPFMGYIIKKLYITVKRSDKSDRSKSMELMKQSIYEGISVFLCPEGTRNRTKLPLLDFKDGAFRLAIEAQVPIAVLTILNSKEKNEPTHPLKFNPGIIYGIWNDPIPTIGLTMEDVEDLKQKARNYMLQNISDYKKDPIKFKEAFSI